MLFQAIARSAVTKSRTLARFTDVCYFIFMLPSSVEAENILKLASLRCPSVRLDEPRGAADVS